MKKHSFEKVLEVRLGYTFQKNYLELQYFAGNTLELRLLKQEYFCQVSSLKFPLFGSYLGFLLLQASLCSLTSEQYRFFLYSTYVQHCKDRKKTNPCENCG